MNNMWIKAGLPIVILSVVFMLAFILLSGAEPPQQEAEERLPMLVKVMTAERSNVRYKISSQGTVQPKLRGDLVNEVSGKVVSVSENFVVGGFVRKGDLLLQIDDSDFKTEVKAAEATLYGARASLEEEKARARVAEEDWRQYKTEEIPELGLRKPQLAKELANLSYAQAQLDQAKRNLKRTHIVAPYDAIISKKQVEMGEFLNKASVIAELYGTEIAEVRLPITDTESTYLELPSDGTPSSIQLSSVIGDKTIQWPAKLVRSEGIIDESSRFIYAVVQVADPYQRDGKNDSLLPLKFGRFVSAQIVGATERNMIRVPRSVVRTGQQVVVVNADNIIEFRTVEIERSEQEHVYIRSGLEDGEKVSLTPVSGLPAGSVVRTAESTEQSAQLVQE
ncbi:efflux RND transporter periplasmic adaptor subunit [Echinimonas agarilytica]|uniref:Efflux RND transporter periplasmic adaptor subunit n=1 Tax=Echinimonas agarilytica TaxID=1215918 RepID=A0AA41W5D6_9GAMM|nr:efflux RND transporter periplasmic adaptor subunit [Echinimonas agarilytica]MCM2679309.1 efflux RND transporter periplasmic adaptor subunit [Echinimonas agarilytica]